MLTALDGAKDDIGAVKANLESWFNGAMDRVSGRYKRRSQIILFALGAFAAISLNVDIVTVAKRLTEDKPLREAVVGQAKNIGKADEKTLVELQRLTFEQLNQQIRQIGYPIGWTWDGKLLWPTPQACQQPPKPPAAGVNSAAPPAQAPSGAKVVPDTKNTPLTDCRRMSPEQVLLMGLGWLATALAVMLGAPFWFDVLNKFMVIRSTVKPREKSQEEGSEDRPQLPQSVSLQLAPRTGKG